MVIGEAEYPSISQRNSTLLLQPVQHTHHVFSSQTLTGFDGQTFARVDIHDHQRTETSAVTELIGE
jgi:hypothetical protein